MGTVIRFPKSRSKSQTRGKDTISAPIEALPLFPDEQIFYSTSGALLAPKSTGHDCQMGLDEISDPLEWRRPRHPR